jgi:RND family efflux transporter MFP subunit
MFAKLIPWVRTHKIIVGVVILILIIIGWKFSKKPVSPYETVAVASADLVQEVSVTGKVQSQDSIDLAFEKGGRITSVLAEVGKAVTRGDTLVRLDSADVSASLAQAEANFAFEEANLAKLLRGSREEDIRVSEVSLNNAQASFGNAYDGLVQGIRGGYTSADDAIYNKTDTFFNNPRTNPELNIPNTNFTLSLDIANARKFLEGDMKEWDNQLSTLTNGADLTPLVSDAKAHLNGLKGYLEKLALLVNSILPSSGMSQTTLDGWKANVSVARTAVNTALTTIIAGEEKWRAADSAVALATQQLALKKAGATAEDISAQKARIASARASIASYRAQLEKLVLTAPFSGIVTRQDAKQGAIASPGVTVVSIQSKGTFKIEANIPEVDIAKINVNDNARITLDAYGDSVPFMGVVALVDPSERVIDGVPTYKVTLTFDDKEEKVRSGMTANINIETDKRAGVLAIPARAVTEKNGTKIVRVLPVGATTTSLPTDRVVETGLRSSDGRVEIVSGLSAGEIIVTFEKVQA